MQNQRQIQSKPIKGKKVKSPKVKNQQRKVTRNLQERRVQRKNLPERKAQRKNLRERRNLPKRKDLRKTVRKKAAKKEIQAVITIPVLTLPLKLTKATAEVKIPAENIKDLRIPNQRNLSKKSPKKKAKIKYKFI